MLQNFILSFNVTMHITGYEGVTEFPGKLAEFVREELAKCSEERPVSRSCEAACNGMTEGENIRTSERLIHKTSIA